MVEIVVENAHELAERISSSEAVPGSGWVAGVSAAFAAALVAKSASRSEGWSGAEGARAQALELRDRLLALAAQDAKAYEQALTARRRAREDELTDLEELRPGVEEYFAEAERLGLRTAVVSSSDDDWIARHLGRLGHP